MYHIIGDTETLPFANEFDSFDEAVSALIKDGWEATDNPNVYEWENFDGELFTVEIVES